MDQDLTTGWSLVGVVQDGGEIVVNGVDPWRHEWARGVGRIKVSHPSYPSQRHLLDVWHIDDQRGRITFAAGELSNGVWCFYAPD